MTTLSFTPRAVCVRCRRPRPTCVCALLPSLAPRARVLILQHPKERRVAIGTGAMASRCLEGSSVVVGTHVEAHPAVLAALSDPDRRPVLLWPGPDAADLALAPPSGPITLLVVDGTWTTAKKLIRLNPAIAALPRYSISPTTPSDYRIRREPRAECLSTIEAIATALSHLECEPESYGAMLEPFRAMVNVQLEHIARGPRPRDKSRLLRRERRAWEPPPALRDAARVVIVAVECNAWPATEKVRHPDEIVQWLAVRGDGSERAEVVASPTHPLAPALTRHTELSADVVLSGGSREALGAAVRAFVRDGDVLATWGTYSTRRMEAEGLAPGTETFNLRRVAADGLRRSPGPVERCVESLGLDPLVLGLGRGGRRLGQMLAVFQALPTFRAPRP